MNKKSLYLILENIRSIYNVGAIFRTADAVGVDGIYLCGCTPGPIDRFGRTVDSFKKTALGAENNLNYSHSVDSYSVVKYLQKKGVTIFSIEQDQKSGNLFERDFHKYGSSAFVFGNEITGVSEQVLNQSNAIIEIPMCGNKESLNVSVSVGVVLYQYRFVKI